MRTVAGLIAVGLLVSGCTGPSSPPPSTKPSSTAQAGPADLDASTRKRLAENAVYRTWDTCALHDPESAKKIFGELDTLTPTDLDKCLLRVKNPNLSSWHLTVSTGALFVADERAQKHEIGGRTVYSESRDAESCGFSFPTAEFSAIAVRASYSGAPGEKAPPKPACDALREYVTALAPIWSNPPLRTEGATDPALPLASKDPCAALPELAKLLEANGKPQVQVGGVYDCKLRIPARSKTGTGEIGVKFRWAADPVPQAQRSPGQYKAIQVEGRQGNSQQRTTCQITVQADDITITGLDEERSVIEVAAPDCAMAESAAKLVVKAAL